MVFRDYHSIGGGSLLVLPHRYQKINNRNIFKQFGCFIYVFVVLSWLEVPNTFAGRRGTYLKKKKDDKVSINEDDKIKPRIT